MRLALTATMFAAGASAFDWSAKVPENELAPTLRVKYLKNVAAGGCEVIEEGKTQLHRDLTKSNVIVERKPQAALEQEMSPYAEPVELVEVFSHSRLQLWEEVERDCGGESQVTMAVQEERSEESAQDEVFGIVVSGDSSNRIDVVYMGDGYTASQRQNHIDDMERLTRDMFEDVTFGSYLPLFNIWGVYRVSTETGVGTHGQPRNTAFRLYRQGTQLRGLYTAAANAARDACRSAPGCDYPSLIGNDPYYGGLGGEFTISTESLTSGTVVLRHELGHNLARVGEEYDGGSAYNGANSASSLSNAISKWGVWMTDADNLEEEVMNHLAQDYAWHDLADGEYTISANSLGYPRWNLRMSASGVETQDSFEVSLDGRVLAWNTSHTLDRSFTEFTQINTGINLTPGQHVFRFRQLKPSDTGDIRQLCSITWVEYEREPLFHQDDEWFTGAYPTFNSIGRKTFRPGNEHCLMRDMSSTVFCHACQESIWHQLLARMSLIDDVEVDTSGGEASVKAVVVGLAQFRPEPIDGEAYEIEWTRNGQNVPSLSDSFDWTMPLGDAQGNWQAQLTFITPEVLQQLDKLRFSHSFTI